MTSEGNDQKGFVNRLRASLRNRFRGSAKKEEAINRAARLRVMYEQFREILNLNDSMLELIADIDDRLSGRVPFSLSMIIHQVTRAVMDVFVMVKNLNQIAEGRYLGLFDALRRVNAQVEGACAVRRRAAVGPIVLPLARLESSDTAAAGAKMANLGEVRNKIGLSVPEGFVITTAAFKRFMDQNELWPRAERLEEVLEAYGDKVAAEACRSVQTAIISSVIPGDVEDAVFESFDALAREQGQDILVAMRSSAVDEDQAASHAGQYYTELNVGRGWLLDAYRWVLASAFSLAAVAYRLEHGLTAGDVEMAVGCIGMIEPRCSGIMFSRSFENPQSDRIVISATRGLADEVTRGAASAEEIVIDSGAAPGSGISCLGGLDLKNLAQAARKMESHFNAPQDIEWAFDQNGKLYILQSRPMITTKAVAQELPELMTDHRVLLSGGFVACPGVGSGNVFKLHDEQDLDRFPKGAVLVALHSSPKYSRVMAKCAAIVTDKGSPIGHMAIVAREFGIPAIVGLNGATSTLDDGQMITVDASHLRIFDGLVEATKIAPEEKPLLSDTPALRKLQEIARWVTPLRLIDPASPEFNPEGCSSLHDITRFIHEKVFEIMFHFSDRAASQQPDSLKLEGNLPYDVFVLDVGRGLVDAAGASGTVSPAEIRSDPMKAFLEGLLDPRIRWDQPRAVSARGFLSVLGESMAGRPAEVQGVGRASFAIISDRYMNFATKAGYHFNTVDTYCGKSLNKNYIHFRFQGGGAGEIRRGRRCQFLMNVLTNLEFKVQCRGDLLVARLEKYDHEFIYQRLIDLGRLTLVSRQLDMLMDNDSSPDHFAKAFLDGQLEKF